MTAKSCEEDVLTYRSAELAQEIEKLRLPLKNAFSEYETNRELVRNPQVWVDYIEDAIERARCLLMLRKSRPELEDNFAKLEISYQHAKKRLPVYAEKKGATFSEHVLL